MTQPPSAAAGMLLAEVDTPTLLLDLDAFERNTRLMSESLQGRKIGLRPHAKSHKCPEIARRQIAAGAAGICCQKVSEAEAFVDGGVRDILISNEIVGPSKLKRLAALARKARVAVCADHALNVIALNAAALAEGVVLDVLLEIDVGGHRCGVEPGKAAVTLATQIVSLSGLRFAGLQAYQSSAQHIRTVAARRTSIEEATRRVTLTRNLLRSAGIPCDHVTGAGTGTYMLEVSSDTYDEVQPGSYIFMDADYSRNEWTGSGIPHFEQSLYVWTSVMSIPAADRAVVDAGLKALSVDSGFPLVHGHEGAEYVNVSDEHGALRLVGETHFALGEKLRLIPGHCDPTVNLHDWIVCVRQDRVEAVWPVSARGALV